MDIKHGMVDVGEMLKVAGAEGGGPVTFAGYASVFGNEDSHGDIVMPGAFAKSIKAMQSVPLLFNHWSENIIGKITSMKEDDKGLYVEGEFTPGHTMASDVAALVRHGAINSFSFAAGILKAKPRFPDGSKPGIELSELAMKEVSFVVFPANKKAKVNPRSIKSEDFETIKSFSELEELLRDSGDYSINGAKAIIATVKRLAQKSEQTDPRDADEVTLEAIGASLLEFQLTHLNR